MQTREFSTEFSARLIDALRRAKGLSVLTLSKLAGVGRSNLAKFLNRDQRSYFSVGHVSACLGALGWADSGPSQALVHRWEFPCLDDDAVFLFGHALGGEAKVTTIHEGRFDSFHPSDGLIVADFNGARIFVLERSPKPKEDISGKRTLDALLLPELGLAKGWIETFVVASPAYSELKYQEIPPARFEELVIERRPSHRFEFAPEVSEVLRTLFADGMSEQELADWLQDIRTLRTRGKFEELIASQVEIARSDFYEQNWWNSVMSFDVSLHRDLASEKLSAIAERELVSPFKEILKKGGGETA